MRRPTHRPLVEMPLVLLEPWSPFVIPTWPGITEPITRIEVAQASPITKPHYGRPGKFRLSDLTPAQLRAYHVGRVAGLIESGWDDLIYLHVHPKTADIVLDGKHRLAATFYLGHEKIYAAIHGEPELFFEKFPVGRIDA